MPTIDRGLVRLRDGEVHLRRAAEQGHPLVLVHASPGSSRALVPLLTALGGGGMPLIAPDTPGNGDSDDLAPAAPAITWYADALIDLLDVLGLDRVHLYGTHTGARIAVEAAARYPGRVERLILDGLIDYSPETRAMFLDRYAPVMAPDDHGGQFPWAFNYVRDQVVHFPHFLRDPAHRLMTRAVPNAAELHAATLDVLKALTFYHKADKAAFAMPVRERLPAVTARTIVLRAEGELPALRDAVEALASLLPDGRIVEVGRTPVDKAAAILAFLRSD